MVEKKVSKSKKAVEKPTPSKKSVESVSVDKNDNKKDLVENVAVEKGVNTASKSASSSTTKMQSANKSLTKPKSQKQIKIGKKSKVNPEPKESITVKARSGNPAKRGEITRELREHKKTVQTVKINNIGPNPAWLVPTFIGLMLIGVIWIVTFYLTAQIGGYPMPVLNYWNLVVGFVFIITGFLLTTKWR